MVSLFVDFPAIKSRKRVYEAVDLWEILFEGISRRYALYTLGYTELTLHKIRNTVSTGPGSDIVAVALEWLMSLLGDIILDQNSLWLVFQIVHDLTFAIMIYLKDCSSNILTIVRGPIVWKALDQTGEDVRPLLKQNIGKLMGLDDDEIRHLILSPQFELQRIESGCYFGQVSSGDSKGRSKAEQKEKGKDNKTKDMTDAIGSVSSAHTNHEQKIRSVGADTEQSTSIVQEFAGVDDSGVSCLLKFKHSMQVDEIDETTLLTRDSQDVFAVGSECECELTGSYGATLGVVNREAAIANSGDVVLECSDASVMCGGVEVSVMGSDDSWEQRIE
jgi:hypothetical protein